ncbi:hypothetical protein AAFF_G00191390 [Aldrovandia affinis]|uniref:Uncharacterized protein n=1 Tax=Aldrovandia affinis TaxID=143900 RepID=A0AAD7RJH9_9TELE|nr:hypothetical protein AAFF_G00191390 [Aldrovandia affinis]
MSPSTHFQALFTLHSSEHEAGLLPTTPPQSADVFPPEGRVLLRIHRSRAQNDRAEVRCASLSGGPSPQCPESLLRREVYQRRCKEADLSSPARRGWPKPSHQCCGKNPFPPKSSRCLPFTCCLGPHPTASDLWGCYCCTARCGTRALSPLPVASRSFGGVFYDAGPERAVTGQGAELPPCSAPILSQPEAPDSVNYGLSWPGALTDRNATGRPSELIHGRMPLADTKELTVLIGEMWRETEAGYGEKSKLRALTRNGDKLRVTRPGTTDPPLPLFSASRNPSARSNYASLALTPSTCATRQPWLPQGAARTRRGRDHSPARSGAAPATARLTSPSAVAGCKAIASVNIRPRQESRASQKEPAPRIKGRSVAFPGAFTVGLRGPAPRLWGPSRHTQDRVRRVQRSLLMF